MLQKRSRLVDLSQRMEQLANLPWQRWLVQAPPWVNIVLIILLAKAAAETTLLLFSAPLTPTTSTLSPRPVAAIEMKSTSRLLTVAPLHLFGEATVTPATQAPIDAEKTQLHLVLRGVFAGDPSKALAIIADDHGNEAVYFVNSVVPGGARLHAIYSDRVILERNGRYESLHLPREELPDGAVAKFDNQPVVREVGGAVAAKLENIRQTLQTNPQDIWKEVRIEPVLDQGRIKGYHLTHNDRQLMKSLGIEPTDVITAVNGAALSDPKVLYNLMTEFNTAQDIRLTVERSGQTEILLIHL